MTKIINLIWKIKLKTIKTLIKWQRKQIKNQKKKDQIEINIITIEKNHKFNLNDKNKNYNKKAKKKKNGDIIVRNK